MLSKLCSHLVISFTDIVYHKIHTAEPVVQRVVFRNNFIYMLYSINSSIGICTLNCSAQHWLTCSSEQKRNPEQFMISLHCIDDRLQKICRQSLYFIQYNYGVHYVVKLTANRRPVAEH